MPRLDPVTLLTVNAVVTLLVGLLFGLAWLLAGRAPHARPLALWGAAHGLGALGCVGLALRGLIPDAASVGAANAAILAAYGLVWAGARAFAGAAPRPILTLAGAALWGALCLAPAFTGSLPARVAVASGLAGAYCLAAAAALRRGGPSADAAAEPLAARRPAVALLALYGAAYLARVPAARWLPTEARALDAPWVTILCLAATAFSIACAFTLAALVWERAEGEQAHAARTDPLTGVANRRAFHEAARAALARPGTDAALLLVDLDRFKGINDTYGHALGDAVLVGFCATASALLPRGALLGRLGGEEFACLLPDASPAAARAFAECLRRAFAALAVPELPDLRVSVSIGLVHARGARDLDALLRRADAALYAAKGNGRDRVEVAGPERARVA